MPWIYPSPPRAAQAARSTFQARSLGWVRRRPILTLKTTLWVKKKHFFRFDKYFTSFFFVKKFFLLIIFFFFRSIFRVKILKDAGISELRMLSIMTQWRLSWFLAPWMLLLLPLLSLKTWVKRSFFTSFGFWFFLFQQKIIFPLSINFFRIMLKSLNRTLPTLLRLLDLLRRVYLVVWFYKRIPIHDMWLVLLLLQPLVLWLLSIRGWTILRGWKECASIG